MISDDNIFFVLGVIKLDSAESMVFISGLITDLIICCLNQLTIVH